MNLLLNSWDFRSVWANLPLQGNIFLACLSIAAIYISISLGVIYAKAGRIKSAGSPSERVLVCRKLSMRLNNFRQLHMLLLLLFGVLLTDEVFRTIRAFSLAHMSLSSPCITPIADPLISFSFSCLLILTFLQLFQWIVSHRIGTIKIRLG